MDNTELILWSDVNLVVIQQQSCLLYAQVPFNIWNDLSYASVLSFQYPLSWYYSIVM